MNRNPNILRYVAFFMLFASMVLIVLGVYFYMKEDAFLKECHLITCRITNIEEKRVGRATLTFKEVNGNYPPFTYFISYDASEDDLGYEEGDIVEVYYYKQDVSKSEIKDFFINHLTSFILIIIGFVFMIDFPILLFVAGIAKKKQQNAQPINIDRTTIISE
jgi:hypothetical protein